MAEEWNDANHALDRMEAVGKLKYPATGHDIKAKVQENWKDSQNVTTFFEMLPDDRIFQNRDEVIKSTYTRDNSDRERIDQP